MFCTLLSIKNQKSLFRSRGMVPNEDPRRPGREIFDFWGSLREFPDSQVRRITARRIQLPPILRPT
jgi:hypothetical protein